MAYLKRYWLSSTSTRRHSDFLFQKGSYVHMSTSQLWSHSIASSRLITVIRAHIFTRRREIPVRSSRSRLYPPNSPPPHTHRTMTPFEVWSIQSNRRWQITESRRAVCKPSRHVIPTAKDSCHGFAVSERLGDAQSTLCSSITAVSHTCFDLTACLTYRDASLYYNFTHSHLASRKYRLRETLDRNTGGVIWLDMKRS